MRDGVLEGKEAVIKGLRGQVKALQAKVETLEKKVEEEEERAMGMARDLAMLEKAQEEDTGEEEEGRRAMMQTAIDRGRDCTYMYNVYTMYIEWLICL